MAKRYDIAFHSDVGFCIFDIKNRVSWNPKTQEWDSNQTNSWRKNLHSLLIKFCKYKKWVNCNDFEHRKRRFGFFVVIT